ncbi:MAG TPA: 2OG-Fe(II) oxygenase [Caulobacteraceae bacterium]|nr:2OG-Fe(II) oxygenase [Caulobacteraceae bacterium]
MIETLAEGVYVRRGFLPPRALLEVLAALDRLGPAWASSREMRLLGRGQTSQVRPTDLVARGPLDEVRRTLAPAVLRSARDCGFRFPAPPTLQLFPVRMLGDAEHPAYQEPHTDSRGPEAATPLCSSVFYARVRGVSGGALSVAAKPGGDLSNAVELPPSANTLVTFPGDRVHAVRPLRAGERISVVINLY